MEIEVVNPSKELDNAKEMEFLDLQRFGAGGTGAYWSEAGAQSPWEMHPECDELLHIIEGKVELEILPSNSGKINTIVLTPGSFSVVPKGCWHRQKILERVKQYYLTPGPTLHSQSIDPRIE
jgi:uncharacterized cupin superfamily protein